MNGDKKEPVLVSGTASRMSAKSVLEHQIATLEDKLEAQKILLRVIPWDDLTLDDESKLWTLFTLKPY